MEVENTPLYRDAREVMANGKTTTNQTWTAKIHYGGKVYNPFSLISVNFMRDYVGAFADEITVSMQIPLGIYARRIYPNRTKLQITLMRIPLAENSDAVDEEDEIQSEQYTALLIDQDRAPTVAQGTESNDEDSLNLTQIIDVHFQIYDKGMEQLRIMMAGGVLRSCKVDNAIKTLLTSRAQDADVDNDRSILGVEMVAANNLDTKAQIVVPHGLRLVDVPDMIQAKYGVYNAGLGSYIQDKYWHVFPLYDTSEYETRLKTITVLVLPKRKFSNIERTYKVKGNALTIVITGETGFKDDSGKFYANHGNGIRFTDANNLFNANANVKTNRLKLERSKNNFEFKAGEAISKANYAPVAGGRSSANPFIAYSRLAARNGGMFKGVWENSDHTLLTPGMPAKIVYSDKDEVRTIYGILHSVSHISQRYSGIGSTKFKNQSILQFFVNGQIEEITIT